MQPHWTWALAALGITVSAGAAFYRLNQVSVHPQPLTSRRSDLNYTAVPTLFVPGWLGSGRSYNSMIAAFQNHNAASKVMTIIVGPTGKIHTTGHLSRIANNPLIQVIFANSLAGYRTHGKELATILRFLQVHEGLTEYHLVAHSWGGNAMLNVLFSEANQTLPILKKLVLLGVPVNEGADNTELPLTGLPRFRAPQYADLLKRRDLLGRQPQLEIFNLIGKLQHRAGDGETKIGEAVAVKPLFAGSGARVTTTILPGLNHHQIHQTHPAFRAIVAALWQSDPVVPPNAPKKRGQYSTY